MQIDRLKMELTTVIVDPNKMSSGMWLKLKNIVKSSKKVAIRDTSDRAFLHEVTSQHSECIWLDAKGDGSCMYRTVSILRNGHEHEHLPLRAATLDVLSLMSDAEMRQTRLPGMRDLIAKSVNPRE